jgi:hypothetical protein
MASARVLSGRRFGRTSVCRRGEYRRHHSHRHTQRSVRRHTQRARRSQVRVATHAIPSRCFSPPGTSTTPVAVDPPARRHHQRQERQRCRRQGHKRGDTPQSSDAGGGGNTPTKDGQEWHRAKGRRRQIVGSGRPKMPCGWLHKLIRNQCGAQKLAPTHTARRRHRQRRTSCRLLPTLALHQTSMKDQLV